MVFAVVVVAAVVVVVVVVVVAAAAAAAVAVVGILADAWQMTQLLLRLPVVVTVALGC